MQGRRGIPDKHSDYEVGMKILANIFKKAFIFNDKIFMAALAASLIWHLLWISALKVVAAPEKAQPVKFSKVSFLGPMQVSTAIEARIIPDERSFLEDRYLEGLKKFSGADNKRVALENPALSVENRGLDNKFVPFIEEAVGGSKEEPSPIVDNYF